MERAWVRFKVDGEWWRRGLRYLIGIVLVGDRVRRSQADPPEAMPYGLEAATRFVRYALLGWMATFLVPWLFVRLRLAKREA